MKFSSKKVLIVEDDVLLSVIEKRLVQKMGHEVVDTVDTGKKALTAVQEKSPDVILMDVKLKGDWDGIDTAQEIQKHFSIPIIYLSGCTDRASRNRAEEVGFSGFLTKPVQMSNLKNAFKRVFNGEPRIHSDSNKVAG
jgi:DNA-binding response OmpR family regulator